MSPPRSVPAEPDPRHKIRVKTLGTLDGFEVEIDFEVEAPKLRAAVEYLRRQGLEAPSKPVVFELTPEGRPICPKHRVPMGEREKQGDRWYSHRVIDPDSGCELYCRGYSGPSSPGFDVPSGLAVPIDQPGGTIGHPLGSRAVADAAPGPRKFGSGLDASAPAEKPAPARNSKPLPGGRRR